MADDYDTDMPRRAMGIWAHPDDEAYLSAGLMARLTDAGRDVTVVTITRGEKGTAEAADYAREHFAEHRERELRASLAELGVHDVRVIGYRDGECHLVPAEEAIDLIAWEIASVAPDVILTFGPDGITGHLDHRVVSSWVTEAWRRLGGRAELLYATMSDDFIDRHAELHERIGLFAERRDGPASLPGDEMAITCDLSEAELQRKRRALARHASQTEPLAALIGEETYRRWWGTESFRRPTAREATTCELCVPLNRGVAGLVPAAA